MRWVLGILALVAACGTPSGPRYLPEGYRDQNIAISSSTRFEAARFSGDWVIIESFDNTPIQVTPDRLTIEIGLNGYTFETRVSTLKSAPELDAAIELPEPVAYRLGEFGRFSPVEAFDAEDPIWVLWIDEDHRTAVLGNPSGRMGLILNRARTIRSDRLQAARNVLAFNGYDVLQLRRVSR